MVKRYAFNGVDGEFANVSDYEKLEQRFFASNKAIEKLEAENRHLRAKLQACESAAKADAITIKAAMGEVDARGDRIEELEKKLAEAEAVQRMAINYEGYLQQLHKFREQEAELSRLQEEVKRLTDSVNERDTEIAKLDASEYRLKAELSRLRDAVPGEVEEAIERYAIALREHITQRATSTTFSVVMKSANELKALIGSLVTTERERVRGMLEEAYLSGAECQNSYQQIVIGKSFWNQKYINDNIEAYAERKMKEGE